MTKNKAILHILKHGSDLAKVKLFERNFLAFALYCFPGIFSSTPAPFHREWCNFMMDDKDFLNISFREGGKTVWAMAYVMWCIIHKKYHFIMWYNFDKSKSNKRLYDIIVQFQTNERINRLYGTFMPDLKGSDSKTKRSVAEFITSNGVMVKSASIGMSPRGEIYVSKDGTAHRPGLVLLDDIDTLKSVASVEIIDKNYRFIKDELMPGMSGFGKIIFLGNIINDDGVVPRIRKDVKGRWNISEIPAEKDGKVTWDRYTLEGDGIKKIVNGKISLPFKRAEFGLTSYQQNFLLIAYANGQTIIKQSDIRYAKRPKEGLKIIFGIDPAFSQKTNSDAMGFVMTAHYRTTIDERKVNQRYIFGYIAFEAMEKDEEKFKNRVKELYVKFKCSLIRIEKQAGGEIIGSMLKKAGMAVDVINAEKDKVTRLREYEGSFNRGEIFFDPDMADGLEKQLLAFPNVEHDDLVDAMVYSLGEPKARFIMEQI